jgi:plastocyanin
MRDERGGDDVTGRWTTRLVVAAATLTLLAAACGSDNSPSSGSTSGGSGSSASAGTTGTGNGTGGSGGYNYGGGGGSTGGGGGGTTTTSGGSTGKSTSTISQANYMFTPSKPSVKSGSTITVKNTTTDTPHTFTVTGQNIDVTVDPGTSAKVKVDLPAGTYPFVCTFHESLGMKGTLTVG